MGNFHCLSSSCATVVYREYLPPSVRWRYPGSNWQEIEGDDYSVETQKGQCYGVAYRPYGTYTSQAQRHSRARCGETWYWSCDSSLNGKIVGYSIPSGQSTQIIFIVQPTVGAETIQVQKTIRYSISLGNPSGSSIIYSDTCINSRSVPRAGNNFQVTDFNRLDGLADNCGDCDFTITLNGETVYTETRDICPEVEVLPCRLSDIRKEIKIDKKPWQEKIQVVGEDNRDALFGDFLETIEEFISGSIPNHCREVWKTISLDFFADNFDDFDSSSYASYYQLISTICSAENCPPPEYQVICNCEDDCQSCPENTCALLCNGSICCYDTGTGKSIKSIPIANYCGE